MGLFSRMNLLRKSRGVPLRDIKQKLSPQTSNVANTSEGETTNLPSYGLLSVHTSQVEAAKNLEKKRRFAEVEGTQGQVILG